jgi:hypothetical protein
VTGCNRGELNKTPQHSEFTLAQRDAPVTKNVSPKVTLIDFDLKLLYHPESK